MKVLILGAKGSLGQVFLELYKDQEIFGWDRNELDITNEVLVNEKIGSLRPDLIINCAAYNAVDRAEDEIEIANKVNGIAPGFLARIAKQIDATLVHYSTGQVFDGSKQEGYNEDAQVSPANAYGQSKLLGESEVAKNSDKFYLIRTSWLFGKPALGESAKKSFTDLILTMQAAGKEINAVADEFGNPTYVVDLAHATRALLEENKPFGIYHLVNSESASRADWAREIFKIKNISTEVKDVSTDFFPRRAKRPKYEILNNTKFIELRPWQEALREYLGN